MKCLHIPREINQQYVLIWKRDEMLFLSIPWILFFVIGGVTGFMLSLIGVIIIAMLVKNISNDKPEGYIMHWLNYNLPKQLNKTVFRKNKLEATNSLYTKALAFPSAHIRHIAG